MQSVLDHVASQVTKLCAEPTFATWLASQKAGTAREILFNNSFVYRLNSKTNKSDLYLGGVLEGTTIKELTAYSGLSPNSDFKVVSEKSSVLKRHPLPKFLPKMMSDLGMLVFVLIGKVDDSEIFTVPVNSKFVKTIVLNRKVSGTAFNGQDVIISDTTEEEHIWEVVVESLKGTAGFEDGQNEAREKFGQALSEIDKQAHAKLLIPAKGAKVDSCILDQLTSILEGQIEEYGSLVEALQDDQGVPNDVLRIAYNFAGDATTMIRLIISICDQKPLVLWCTLHDHFLLSEAFKSLPWVKSKHKASLKGYIDTIGDARNSAFHRLFPFKQAVDVILPTGSIRNPVLRIFSEFSRKSENELTYEDKELIGVLTEFTRVTTTNVSSGFWLKNLDVMKKTRDLFAATSTALKLLHSEI